MNDFCDTQTYPGSYESPPEYCEDEPLDGTDKCPRHQDADGHLIDRANQIRKGE